MNRMTVTWFLVALLAGCDSWAPEPAPEEMATSDEMDETIEVRSVDHAEELGLDIPEYLESRALVASAPDPALLATVTCGGLVYTKQTATGCTGSVCRTSNTPAECANSQSPCAFYTGSCVGGGFVDRPYSGDNDLYWKEGAAGNPTPYIPYWSLHTGSNLTAPVYYRAAPAQSPAAEPSVPSAWGSDDLEILTCPSGAISPGLKYLKARPANVTSSGGRWWVVLPAIVNGLSANYFHAGSCSGGKLSYLNTTTRSYYDGSHGWYSNQPAWVIDAGPTSGSPTPIAVRQVAPTIPPDPGDDDGTDDGGPTCTPFPQSCTLSSQCCAGTSCLDTIGPGKQCCACFWLGNGQYCGSPAQCANAQAEGKDVIWPGSPRWPEE